MALPNLVDPTAPANTDSPGQGALQIRNLKQYIIDVFGVPNAVNVTAAPFVIAAGGGVTVSQSPFTVPTLMQGTASQILRIESSYSQILLGVGGYSLMSIGPTNIGIGIGNPTASLHVASNIYLGGQLYANPGVTAQRIINLVGQNDATTPNTKYGFSADAVTLRSVSGQSTITRYNTGTLTCNLGVTGANGLDAGIQAASTWYHFYFIDNGSTTASLASLTAPPTGPALPSGYTHWGYAGAIFSNSVTRLLLTTFRGSLEWYTEDKAVTAVITNGTANAETAVSVSSFVPPNALSFFVNGTTAGNQILHLRSTTGNDMYVQKDAVELPMALFAFPNRSQQFFYFFTVSPVNGFEADVVGFMIPNGGG